MEVSHQIKLSLIAIQNVLNSTQPCREAFHRHGGSYRGQTPSNKGVSGEPLKFESGLAHDALRIFELAHEVIMIVPEPGEIPYTLDGRIHTYVPDYLLYLRNGKRALVEIKYAAEAVRPENKARFSVVSQLVEHAGSLFAIFTEQHLRTPVLHRGHSGTRRPLHSLIRRAILSFSC